MTSKPFSFPPRRRLLAVAAALLGSGLPLAAQAYDKEFDNGIKVDVTNRVVVSAAERTEDRAPDLIGIANGGTAYSVNYDDGDVAFSKNQLVNGGIRLVSDASVSYKDFGVFARGLAYYSPTLSRKGYFDPADFGPGKQFGQDVRQDRDRTTGNFLGYNAELRDAYAYGSVPLPGERSLSVRVGRQTLNWGESTLVFNGLNSILALDANKARLPGFELDEVIIPQGMAWGQVDVVNNVSAEAFYQFEWRETQPDAPGSFFSTNDFAAKGANAVNLGFGFLGENSVGSTVPRGPDRAAKNGGQYGGALRFSVPQLDGAQIALYAANYHSHLPSYSGVSRRTPFSPVSETQYFVEYPEDIHLYGMSFNASGPLGTALQGEYSFKQGVPLQLDDVELLLAGLGAPSQVTGTADGSALGGQYIRGWRRKNVSQVDLGLTKVVGPSEYTGASQHLFLAEGAGMIIHGLESPDVLRYDAPATYTPGSPTSRTTAFPAGVCSFQLTPLGAQPVPCQDPSYYPTHSSWGYKLLTRWTYDNVFDLFTFNPTLRFEHDVRGTSPNPLTNFVADRKTLALGLGATFRNGVQAELGYTSYFGGGNRNLLRDRDFVSAFVKYTF